MTIPDVGAWLMVTCGGLFGGAILFVAVERTNLWRRMTVEQYVIDFRRSLYRLDPLIPILGTLSAIGAVVFAVNTNGHAATLAWIGVALIALIIIASIVIAEPMNSKFRRLPEGHAPEGAERLRTTWRRFHLARTVVTLAALACLAGAVADHTVTMTITHISGWFMVAFTGLFAGAMLVYAVERTNLWRRMPVEQYAEDFRRSVRRAGLMPVLGVLGAIGAAMFALTVDGRATVLAGTGAALIAIVFIATVLVAGPINTKFLHRAEGEVPADAEHLRDTWRRFHWARTAVVLAALACCAVATI
jgi:Domain of unknown function (DUF1772)